MGGYGCEAGRAVARWGGPGGDRRAGRLGGARGRYTRANPHEFASNEECAVTRTCCCRACSNGAGTARNRASWNESGMHEMCRKTREIWNYTHKICSYIRKYAKNMHLHLKDIKKFAKNMQIYRLYQSNMHMPGRPGYILQTILSDECGN